MKHSSTDSVRQYTKSMSKLNPSLSFLRTKSLKESRKILIISCDSTLADVGYQVLVKAGFKVASATSIHEARQAFEQNTFDAAIVGYSLPPSEKKRALSQARLYGVSTLEVYEDEEPTMNAASPHDPANPGGFLNELKLLVHETISTQ